ncbi:MAG: glycoside hydrolase family 3 C-terminal domain-containing protein, partial [Bifidobacteriaceae bacterium]|nr:glycoside hydrolase family 3 C-terminal domain-containing protein [Bifidobacteriaceae bacterium]
MNQTAKRPALGLPRAARAALTAALGLGLLATGTASLTIPEASAAVPAYLDTSLSFDERAADLVSRMTLQEKVLQLSAQTQSNQEVNAVAGSSGVAPAIPRLGVEAYNYWNEALHGVARAGRDVRTAGAAALQLNDGGLATEMPTGLGIAASWNRDLVYKMMDVVSTEARAYTNFGNPTADVPAKHMGLTYWSPTINMHRDPRWGRAEETYGEDPFLTGEIGKEFVWGMQGAQVQADGSREYVPSGSGNKVYFKTATTPKHYYANNSETNRHNGSAELTTAEIREYYTPAFAALTGSVASEGARARSLMTAYNHVNGVPMSASYEALETFARRTWGFDGVVVSDCDAIRDSWWPGGNGTIWQPDGVQLTQRTGIAWTLKAGTDLDCMDGDYTDVANGLIPSLKDGNLTEANIDIALIRAFRERMQFGEFDSFYGDTAWGALDHTTVVDTPYNRDSAKQGAKEGTVLLKNAGGALPLADPAASPGQNYVVVGHMARIPVHGDYSPSQTFQQLLSVRQAVSEYILDRDPTATVDYVWGLNQDEKELGRKKPTIGRAVEGSPSAVRFLQGNATSGGDNTASTGRVTPEEIIKSMDYDGWRGVAPWSGSKTNPAQGYTALNSYGAWGGYFGIDVEIPENTSTLAVDYATQSANYSGGTGITCYTATNIPGTLTARLGSRDGAVLGTVAITTPATQCIPTATASPLLTTHSAVINEVVKGRIASLAGTHQKIYFEWDSDYFAPEFTPAEETQIRNADAVIVYTGTTSMQSVCLTNPGDTACSAASGGTGSIAYDSSEDEDRSSVDLPRAQDDMIAEVAALNNNTIAWIQSVSMVDVSKFKSLANVPAIVWTTYNGEFQGLNVPYTLFGQDTDLYDPGNDGPTAPVAHVPSGKLPFTWYSDIKDLGDTKDYQMTPDATHNGRTYQYFNGPVDYPFGYGLSYATFTYSAPVVTGPALSAVTPNDTLTVKVNVTNTSAAYPGKAVVELYAKSPNAADALRPDIQLKGFGKTSELAPGASEEVAIELAAKDLWFWDSDNERKTYDLGQWTLATGPSSAAADLQQVNFTLSGALTPAIENVVAVPDGAVLNTAAPNSAIHANLSATRNDQSFYDLGSAGVAVAYTSSNQAVAAVDASGAVLPVGPGVATITATVSADGATGSTSFPVVVYAGASNSDGETVYAKSVDFADRTVTLAEAKAGVALASALSGADSAAYSYYAATGEANTAQALVSDGVLRASRTGQVRVTAVARDAAGYYFSHTATVTVEAGANPPAETDTTGLNAAIVAAEEALAALDPDQFTPASLAAAGQAIADAKAVLTDPTATQERIDAAAEAVGTALATAPQPRGDQSLIAPKLAAAQALVQAGDAYTPESVAALAAAVKNAAALAASSDPDISEADVEAVLAALSAAIDGVVLKSPDAPGPADVAALSAMVGAVTAAGAKAADYTTASWAAYAAALSQARAAVAAGNAAAAVTAKAALESAVARLAPRTATAGLTAALAVAKAIKTGSYTAASAAALSAAIAAAEALVAPARADTVTAAQVASASLAIGTAIGNLVVLEPDKTGDVPPKVLKAAKPKIKGTAKVGKKLT